MNSQLNGKLYNIPQYVLDFILNEIEKQNKHVDGIDRARRLLKDKHVNYNQLKRILHDMKYCDKEKDIEKYNLWGGEVFENWGKTILNNDREFIKDKKSARQTADNITTIKRKNSFLKTHTKKDKGMKNFDFLKSNSDKNYVAPLMSLGLFEEINRINKIMKYL